jgi:hypothetical protein
MAFGKPRKIWEKIKGFARKVWGGIKKALPLIKGIGGAVATGLGGPGAGLAVSKGFDIGEAIGDKVADGTIGSMLRGLTPKTSLNDRLAWAG